MITSATKIEIPAKIRQLLIHQLGAALAAAWRQQHTSNDERPDESMSSGRGRGNVAHGGGHEQPAKSITVAG
jgi:hypothetical protein